MTLRRGHSASKRQRLRLLEAKRLAVGATKVSHGYPTTLGSARQVVGRVAHAAATTAIAFGLSNLRRLRSTTLVRWA
jgi:hypothetical protein